VATLPERQDQAAAKQQQLAAIAAENAEREAVAVLPPPTGNVLIPSLLS
jgi:hypothetical protein